ncbi:MAG: UDP-2,3-diacylglucosamine diphosphatase [Candidatus Accumulibacter sp.]|jgi:UDP-2,3-diacylglucosamine hydrolase|nr:UDP-2,3-diacylglucosamine diphosphatase [Accumulibacter sp.]
MIHFVSDIHLSSHAPAIANRFLGYLNGPARQTGNLFILGDLFEVWIGDDSIRVSENAFLQKILEAFSDLTASGIEVSIMHGNRDFLLGREFCSRTGARLISDPYILSVPPRCFALSHGDALCVNDADYQAFRAAVRSEKWRDDFLSKSLQERDALAVALRNQSIAANKERGDGRYADLDIRAIEDFLRRQEYPTFIHGHTHRPATHEHIIDGIRVERWVLADWNENGGEYLCWNGERLTRHTA